MSIARFVMATSLLVAVFSAGSELTDAKLLLYPPGSGASRRIISSGELRLAVNDIDGRFTIGTTDGKSLLFGFPHEGATSHAHFFVDDSVAGTYSADGGAHPDPAHVILSPVVSDGSVVASFEVSGVRFEQKLTITEIGERSTVLIEYTATNTSAISRNAGLLLFFDTMINTNDYAPIATEYGYFAVEREFVAPEIPAYWQAFESSPWQPEDSLIGSGILIGASAVPPDRIAFGDFWRLRNTVWNYSVSGDPYSDSAVLMRWDARALLPGESRRMATYYGLGNVEIVIGDLNLSLSAPYELAIESCSFRTPNPFPVNLLVSNATGIILPGLFAKIDLPEGFHLSDGYTADIVVPDFLAPGASSAISWIVYTDDGYFPRDTSVDITVSAWSSATETTVAVWSIAVPGIDGRGPSAELVAPSAGSFIACDTLPLLIRLGEPGEIDVTTIDLFVDGVRLSYPNPRLEYSGSFLRTWIPSVELEEGDITISFGDIRDRHGCPLLSDYIWHVFLDWHAPVAEVISPIPGETIVYEGFEVIVSLEDLSGVEDSSLYWVVDDIELDLPIEIVGGRATLRPMDTGLIPLGHSTHRICLAGIHDKAYGYCGPNTTEPACVEFIANIERPYARIVEPAPNSHTSCSLQRIVVQMVNPTGTLDPATIVLTVDSVDWRLGDEPLILVDSMLIFTPLIPFADGARVEASVRASTFTRTSITPLTWSFWVDLSSPQVSISSPSGGIFSTHSETMDILLLDNGAGIDYSTLSAEVSGVFGTTTLSIASPELHHEGDLLRIDPSELSWVLHGGDTATVRIRAFDRAFYCPPNFVDREVAFVVPATPPVYSSPSIPEMTILSCDTLSISFALTDDEGLDLSSAIVLANSIEIPFSSTAAYLEGDSVHLNLPWPISSDTIRISISGIADIFGNEVDHTIKLTYIRDAEPPVVSPALPSPEFNLLDMPDSFVFDICDLGSGLNPEACFVSLGGLRVDASSGLRYDSGILTAPTSVLIPFTGDSLRVCVYSEDNSRICGVNTDFSCWIYHFDFSRPTAELISPTANFVGCVDEPIIFRLFDEQGIDPVSIALSFRGLEYTLLDTSLHFDGEFLEFYPDTAGLHGQTCTVALTSCSDISGNSIAAPIEGNFTFDFRKPQIRLISPEGDIRGPLQRLVFSLEDSPAGISPESIELTIDGILFSIDSPALSFVGSQLVFDPRLAEDWLNTTEISLSVGDAVSDCPNIGIFNVTLQYIPAEPSVGITFPTTNSSIACSPLHIEASFESVFGLDLSGLVFTLNGMPITATEPSISGGYINVTCGEIPAGAYEIVLLGLTDTLGNSFNSPISSFLLDLQAPTIDRLSPSDGENAIGENLIISARVTDELSGLNLDQMAFRLNDTVYYLDSPLLQLLGDSLALDASTLNLSGVVTAQIEAADKTTSCGPNVSSRAWQFYVNNGGPCYSLIEPFDGAITHDPYQRIVIEVTDPEGISPSSLSLNINGQIFPFSSSMNFTGGVLDFQQNIKWNSGTLYNITIYAEDSLGNSSSRNLGSFITDFDAPQIVNSSPEHNSVLRKPPETIILNIRDEVSGFDPASFTVEYRGLTLSADDDGIYSDSSTIIIDAVRAGLNLASPDSVLLKITGIADFAGDYGAPNVAEELFLAFTIVDEGCQSSPRPFTPNSDGFYDEVTIFTGLPEPSAISLFTVEGRLVRRVVATGKWNWDGRDEAGTPMPQGIYLFTVSRERDDEVRCGGTVILAR